MTRKTVRWTWLVALAIVLASPGIRAAGASAPAAGVPGQVAAAVAEAREHGQDVCTLLVAAEPQATVALARRVRAAGGSVVFADDATGFMAVRLPVQTASELSGWPGIVAVSPDSSASSQQSGTVVPLAASASGGLGLVSANRKAIGVPEFTAATGADGAGVTIAIVDTGVDPGIPELAVTTAGTAKISDWQDFTGEGLVSTPFVASAFLGNIYTIYGNYSVRGIPSLSGKYHYGIFDETSLPAGGPLGGDINHDGRANDTFGVLVVDTHTAGVYDTVYIDTNQNHSFADEQPLHLYSTDHSVAWLGSVRPGAGYQATAVVCAKLAADGSSLDLGFDGNGHGTHVAGIAAAYPNGAGGLWGVAPGAHIMALKALGSDGNGSWVDISEAMIYAAQHGANIISLSVAAMQEDTDVSAQTQLIRVLSERYGVVIVVAAGNNGPGLGTVLAPGDATHALTVGAYLSPEMWQLGYGAPVGRTSLWFYSAVGPRADGGLGPNLVAPGVAASTVPRWVDPAGYRVLDGTSMSVPYVAGAAALLESAAHARRLGATWRSVERALELGAVPVAGYTPAEEGHGALQVMQAWSVLAGGRLGPELTASIPSAYGGTAGIYAKDYVPGSAPVRFTSDYGRTLHLQVDAGMDWISPERPRLDVPPYGNRSDLVYFNPLAKPGLYGTFVTANDPAGRGLEGQLPVTVAVPWDLSGDNSYWRNLYGEASPGRYIRYFLRVPVGTVSLDLNLSIARSADGGYSGVALMAVFNPQGYESYLSGLVGAGTGRQSVEHQVYDPRPGVWEVVVYSSEKAAMLGLASSRWTLSAQAQGIFLSQQNIAVTSGAASGQGFSLVAVEAANRLSSLPLQLTAVGLGGAATRTWLAGSIGPAEDYTETLPYVGTTSFFQVAVAEMSDPAAIVSLTLQRVDQDGRLRYVDSATSRDGTPPVVTLASAPAGQYIATVSGYGVSSQVAFALDVITVPARNQVYVQDQAATRRFAGHWQASVAVRVPSAAGTYHGMVFAHELNYDRYYPVAEVTVNTGGGALTAEVLPASAGQFVFSARSGASAPTGTVVLNGRVFWAEGGRASFLANPPGAGTMIDVAMAPPGYEPFAGRFYLAQTTDGPVGVFPWQVPGTTVTEPGHDDREEQYLRAKVDDELQGP